ncbi:hypothetical protein PC119_g12505 [Phytophthora cactorum]|uniref:Transcription activator GCR1-like domain-containing protein n=1 Tax=Phytophthora cactorum TaxID=29920 RepID=A0A8T0Z132_9STRA|nr:hypothetical protein PC113_g12282 [Phytophthora cactorum]KAG3013439.1 hypothetical protein PC119_g12505 [Phytophthora cactorum]
MTEESRMNVELEESVLRAYTKASNIRPKNTSRAYKNKQIEFTRWCDDKGLAFNDLSRYTVTGPKLHLFLEEINDYPFPRDDAVFALLKVTDYEEDDPRRKNFEDRGANTMLDGYTTTDQLGKIASFFWSARRNGEFAAALKPLKVKLISGEAAKPTTDSIATASNTNGAEGDTVDEGVISYRMSRIIVSVRELWNEWEHGLSGGRPVKELEEQHGARWCTNGERRFFNRRRKIIDLVTTTADKMLSREAIARSTAIDATVTRVDTVGTAHRISLNWLSLNAETAARQLGVDVEVPEKSSRKKPSSTNHGDATPALPPTSTTAGSNSTGATSQTEGPARSLCFPKHSSPEL